MPAQPMPSTSHHAYRHTGGRGRLRRPLGWQSLAFAAYQPPDLAL